MKRPTIKSPCAADQYHGEGERIAEFSFPNGKGGLISLIQRDAQCALHVYRQDEGVSVTHGNARDWTATEEGINEGAILDAIVTELDQQTWTPDTLDRIAGILRAAGYEIRDVEIPRCPDCTSALTDRTHLEDGTPTYCDACDREVATP